MTFFDRDDDEDQASRDLHRIDRTDDDRDISVPLPTTEDKDTLICGGVKITVDQVMYDSQDEQHVVITDIYALEVTVQPVTRGDSGMWYRDGEERAFDWPTEGGRYLTVKHDKLHNDE
ncbi:hypothetical protein [Halomicrobium sp. LC1Hm]|uniref:hypothetical protein n=1 Tax=Halomicrobium sp. LC1Hm TaxID=2610902 RepID=UPI0012982780|nr:hypothetical protein [Halomicrobium sp. LC1Hm]QGA82767.1 hypothetical protein LC1Hm_1723 [Halomicrobium sp. LC1Hm]